MRPRLIPLCLVIAFTAPAVFAQEFWEKKPFTQWTEKECRKLLEDSPWTKQQIVSRTFIQRIGTPATTPGREQHPTITYTVQLRSAAPVRQAMVRLEAIAKRYDEMNAEQKTAFDQQAERFISNVNPNYVVVYVEYASNVPAVVTELEFHWKALQLARAKNEISLYGSGGQRVEPTQMTHRTDANGFSLVFTRNVEGTAVLAEDGKELKVEFPHPNLGGLGDARILITYKAKEMRFREKLEY